MLFFFYYALFLLCYAINAQNLYIMFTKCNDYAHIKLSCYSNNLQSKTANHKATSLVSMATTAASSSVSELDY